MEEGSQMIQEYDRVVTLVDKPGCMSEEGIPAGSIGVVIEKRQGGKMCIVEIWGHEGYPADVGTYRQSELELYDKK